jgi:putative tricarboxylic transport membrane protein
LRCGSGETSRAASVYRAKGPKMRKSDLIGGGIFVSLGIFILLWTLGFPTLDKDHPGPALFPRILAALFIFFGGIVFYRGWKDGKGEAESEEEASLPQNYFNPIFVLILVGIYIGLSQVLGFYITSTLVLFLMMLKLQVPYLRSILISVLLTLFVNFMFSKLLRVPLPIGFLGW